MRRRCRRCSCAAAAASSCAPPLSSSSSSSSVLLRPLRGRRDKFFPSSSLLLVAHSRRLSSSAAAALLFPPSLATLLQKLPPRSTRSSSDGGGPRAAACQPPHDGPSTITVAAGRPLLLAALPPSVPTRPLPRAFNFAPNATKKSSFRCSLNMTAPISLLSSSGRCPAALLCIPGRRRSLRKFFPWPPRTAERCHGLAVRRCAPIRLESVSRPAAPLFRLRLLAAAGALLAAPSRDFAAPDRARRAFRSCSRAR